MQRSEQNMLDLYPCPVGGLLKRVARVLYIYIYVYKDFSVLVMHAHDLQRITIRTPQACILHPAWFNTS